GRARLVAQRDAVAQAVVYDRAYVVGGDVIVALEPRVGAGAPVESEASARARPDLDPLAQLLAVALGIPRREHEVDDVLLHRRRPGDGVDLLAGVEDGLLRHRRLFLRGRALASRRVLLAAHEPDDLAFRRLVGVADEDVHDEAVELGLGERVGALLLD